MTKAGQDGPANSSRWIPLIVCAALFVDVPVPVFGSVLRLVLVPTVFFVLLSRRSVATPRSNFLALAFPAYFALPWLFGGGEIVQVLLETTAHLVIVGVAVLAARELVEDRRRQRLIGYYISFSTFSAVIAVLQRQGLVGPLGRDLWGRATTADGQFRGAGMLSDPNFLAVLLASSVPLIVLWKRTRLRVPALVAVAAGLFSTNSRAGIVLALIAVAILLLSSHRPGRDDGRRDRGRRLIASASVLLVISFAANLGGQRDRVLDGLQVAISGTITAGSQSDLAAEASASDRREYADAWLRLGFESLPWGAGIEAQDHIVTESGRRNAAHNNFIQLFGQGGIPGALIAFMTAAAGATLFRRRSSDFALTGFIIIVGGLFLSYPGTALVAFPLGIADAIASHRRGSGAVVDTSRNTGPGPGPGPILAVPQRRHHDRRPRTLSRGSISTRKDFGRHD